MIFDMRLLKLWSISIQNFAFSFITTLYSLCHYGIKIAYRQKQMLNYLICYFVWNFEGICVRLKNYRLYKECLMFFVCFYVIADMALYVMLYQQFALLVHMVHILINVPLKGRTAA